MFALLGERQKVRGWLAATHDIAKRIQGAPGARKTAIRSHSPGGSTPDFLTLSFLKKDQPGPGKPWPSPLPPSFMFSGRYT